MEALAIGFFISIGVVLGLMVVGGVLGGLVVLVRALLD